MSFRRIKCKKNKKKREIYIQFRNHPLVNKDKITSRQKN